MYVRLRILGLATLIVAPFLASATQISEFGTTTSVPSALLNTWSGNPELQSLAPTVGVGIDEWMVLDTQGTASLLPAGLSLDPSAGESAVSLLGKSEPGSRLTLAILIFIVLAALMRGFPSPAFSGFDGHLIMERRADSTVLGLVSILYSMAVFFLKWRKA